MLGHPSATWSGEGGGTGHCKGVIANEFGVRVWLMPLATSFERVVWPMPYSLASCRRTLGARGGQIPTSSHLAWAQEMLLNFFGEHLLCPHILLLLCLAIEGCQISLKRPGSGDWGSDWPVLIGSIWADFLVGSIVLIFGGPQCARSDEFPSARLWICGPAGPN